MKTKFDIDIDIKDSWKAEEMLKKNKIKYTSKAVSNYTTFYFENKGQKEKAFKLFNSGKGLIIY